MKKIIYIIPGQGENCTLARYKALAKVLVKKGYNVKKINPDWYRPLFEQIFPVEKDAVILGFSFGAVFAYLLAKKYPCRKVIFASLSPLHTFSRESLIQDMRPYMAETLAHEIAIDFKHIKIQLISLKVPYICLAGQYEKGIAADFLVPKSGHRITPAYIKCIEKLV
jgi:pimeloyl-ACP methyl ester carboxylesterase